MFTGIIERTGKVVSLEERGESARLTMDVGEEMSSDLAEGESVASNGCCLTVTKVEGTTAIFDLLEETLRVTNLGALKAGSLVNLERSLRVGDRMSGHFVQGHVDCVSEVVAIERDGEDHRLEIALPAEFAKYVVYKGSVAVDGISLTAARVSEERDKLTIWIIPHTWEVTNLHARGVGEGVNLEFDVLAKYVEGMVGLD